MIKECSSCRELIIYPTAKFCPACGAGLVSEAGRYYVTTFNATGLASGIYIYRLTTEQKADVRKMLLVK